MKIRVTNPGLLSTVQDLGRQQHRSSGIPVGGAADTWSHRIANILLGNEQDMATIEIAGGRFSAIAESEGWVAVCGLGARFFHEQTECANGSRCHIKAGDTLEIKPAPNGNYCYLATTGGWGVPVVLGSRSTCLSGNFGGHEGRALRSGDVLKSAAQNDGSKYFSAQKASKWFVSPLIFPDAALPIRVIPGPEFECWSQKQQTDFFSKSFLVTSQRNRMGVRLAHSEAFLQIEKIKAMPSIAVSPGTVQVPPDAQPIVLLADAQTTGGYPRIGQLAAVDMHRMAQMPTNHSVRFEKISLGQAEDLLFEQEKVLQKIRRATA